MIEKLRKNLGKIVIGFVVTVGAIVFVNYLRCPGCFSDQRDVWYTILFTILISIALWLGNDWVQNILDEKIGWLKAPIKRLILGVVLMVICSWLIAFAVGAAFWYVIAGMPVSEFVDKILPDLSFTIIAITAIISVIMHGRVFLLNWRKASLELERVKHEKLASQYQSLKDQLNPHFLFNNLNSLTALIRKDPDRAVDFVKGLSEVYRYVLQFSQKEVVPLDQELAFITTYLELLSIRFGQNLRVQVQQEGAEMYQVPPLTLQLLVENAIKHNVISASKPLDLLIAMEAPEYVSVRNTLQKKWEVTPSSGIGLQNIRNRLKFLTDSALIVQEEETEFIVKVPLLHLSEGNPAISQERETFLSP